jgi:hypothetical protein
VGVRDRLESRVLFAWLLPLRPRWHRDGARDTHRDQNGNANVQPGFLKTRRSSDIIVALTCPFPFPLFPYPAHKGHSIVL